MRARRSVWTTAAAGLVLAIAAPGVAQSPDSTDPAGTEAQATASAAPSATDAPPTPAASLDPAVSLGADTVLFIDTFDEVLWGVTEGDSGSIAYSDGALTIKITADDNTLWSWREWAGTDAVMRIEGSLSLGFGQGSGGYLCGSETPDFLGVVVDPDEWVAIQIVENHTTVLARGPLPSGSDPFIGLPLAVAVECAVTGEGGDRLIVSIDGTKVADLVGPNVGPFDRATVYAGAITAPVEATFDDVTVLTGDTYAPSTTAPTPDPFMTPTPRPSLEPVTSLGADTVIFTDTFDDETLWVVGETDDGSVAYDDGTIGIDVTGDDSSLWTWYRLGSTHDVLRADGSVTINEADGGAGWTCGSDDQAYLIGIVNTEDWILGTIVDSNVSVLDRGPLPESTDLGAGGTANVAIECAVTGSAATRLVMWVDDALVGDASSEVAGPFDRVGAYADVGTPPMSARFDDLTAMAGETYEPVIGGPTASEVP